MEAVAYFKRIRFLFLLCCSVISRVPDLLKVVDTDFGSGLVYFTILKCEKNLNVGL